MIIKKNYFPPHPKNDTGVHFKTETDSVPENRNKIYKKGIQKIYITESI